jgi:hemolysin III
MHHGEKFNAFSHLAGAALALTGLVFLTVRASLRGDPWKIASAGIYGATLVGLYFFSTLYHSARDGGAKKILRKIDHSAIYLLIAGTYTPFTLVTLRGAWGWSLFGVIWGLAVTGIVQDLLFAKGHRIFSVALYVLMGWLSVIAVRPLTWALPAPGFDWLVAGGVFYTVGIIFYALDRHLPHGHGIFHLFVLAGSICHYVAILLYVV